jgi:hypothetical protein
MPTYTDQLNSVNALTNSLVYENNTRAITGTNHNLQELGQNASMFANLVAYDNYNYKVVRTNGIPTDNGDELRDAYADAATVAGLSATNRFAILLPPGVYALGANGLDVDTEFIDIIGLGHASDVVITSVSDTNTGSGTIIQTADDVRYKNLTITNAASTNTGADLDDSGYAPSGAVSNTVMEDIIFLTEDGGAPFMRRAVEYAGTYTRCKGVDQTIAGYISVMFQEATGTFTDCETNTSGFGVSLAANGVFNRCKAKENSFGAGAGSCDGTFTDCVVDEGNSFGYLTDNVRGKFYNCRAGRESFGGSFGSAVYVNCVSGDNSFGQFGQTLSGTYKGCVGGDASFGYNGCIIEGVFEECSSGDNSFGSIAPSITGAKFVNCIAGDASFGHNQAIISSSYFINCRAGNQSFGYGDFPATPSSVDGGEFIGCTGGDECWSWLVPTTNNPRFINCSGGLDCFNGSSGLSLPLPQQGPAYYENCRSKGAGVSVGASFRDVCVSGSVLKNCSSDGYAFLNCEGTLIGCYAPTGFVLEFGANAIDCHAEGSAFNFGFASGPYGLFDFDIINCSAGDESFGYIGTSTIGGGTLELIGSFHNCKAGDKSFGCTFGANSSVEFTGNAYNCTAGEYSFGACVQPAAAGSHTEVIGSTAILQDCRAEGGSFAGAITSQKRGTFIRCYCINSDADNGPLFGPTGYMEDCTWIAQGTAKSAIKIQDDDARIYGGIYKGGTGVVDAIVSNPPATPYDAKIIGIKTNGAIASSIFNTASTGGFLGEGNFKYTDL